MSPLLLNALLYLYRINSLPTCFMMVNPLTTNNRALIICLDQQTGGCFTDVSRALQKFFSKFVYCTNSTCDENFKLKLCTCAQSKALGTRTNFQIEILTINVISGVVYFRENILGSSRNVSETTPWC